MKFIYKITSPKSKIYIGQTVNIKKRTGEYKRNECPTQRLLHRSINKHGWDTHKMEVILRTDQSNSDEIEKCFIKFFNCYYYDNPDIGLNLTLGGKSTKGHKMTQEAKNLSLITKKTGISTKVKWQKKQKNYNKIVQKDISGNVLKIWSSVSEVAKSLSLNGGSIKDCASKKPQARTSRKKTYLRKTIGGYKWEWLDGEINKQLN